MKTLLLGILLISVTSFTLAQSTGSMQPEEIYLLMGQSNMAGRGKVDSIYSQVSSSKVVVLNKSLEWVVAKHPLHYDKSVAGVGPGLSFGIEMQRVSGSKTVGLVPCAVGGTSIDKWVPGAYDEPTKTHPWDDAVKRIEIAMKTGKIKGVIWHQGESDSNPKAAGDYLKKLESLIERVRVLTGDPRLPFVVGELGRYKPNYALINDQLQQVPALIANTRIVSSEGLTPMSDNTHFDSVSADEYGKRYAKAMAELAKGKK